MALVLLESASVEIVGVVTEYGRDAPKDPRTGSFAGSLTPIAEICSELGAPFRVNGYSYWPKERD